MVSMPGLGDPDACDRAAADCERAAQQLDAPVQRLGGVRGRVGAGWQGTAGSSLDQVVGNHSRGLQQVQSDLRTAATSLHAAARQIRDAIRRAEEEKRRQQARRAASVLSR